MNRRTACMLTTSFGGSSRIMVVYLWKVTTGRLVCTFARNSFAGFGEGIAR